jgi:hypothetical protein
METFMAWTMPQYEKLCAAIARGVMRVRYDAGNEVTYQTSSDMLNVKREMETALKLNSDGTPLSANSFNRTVGVYRSGR